MNRDGQTILMVTHSIQAAARAGRVLFIKDGKVFHQIYRDGRSDDEMYQRISDTLVELQRSGKDDNSDVSEDEGNDVAREVIA